MPQTVTSSTDSHQKHQYYICTPLQSSVITHLMRSTAQSTTTIIITFLALWHCRL